MSESLSLGIARPAIPPEGVKLASGDLVSLDRVALAVKCSHVLEEAAVPIVGTMKPLNGVGYARWRAARGDFQGTLTAGIGAVGRSANECGLIVAATSAIATSAMMLRNDLQRGRPRSRR